MARLQIKGLDEYSEKLQKLYKDSEIIMKKAIYKSAGFVADNMKAAINSIPIQEGPGGLPPYGSQSEPLVGISRKQKGDLMDGFGISAFEKQNGYINVKLGFDGYGTVPTRRYPQGLPNVLLARSITTGTSFRKKNPAIRQAVQRSKNQAVEIMSNSIDEDIRKDFG